MNLLSAVLYDPTTAVSKATTALLAMTALDTANLRATFTVPPSGKAKVIIMGGVLHGATTYPVILLGVMNGATVVARVAPNVTVCGAAAATTPATMYAEFIVSGLTPGTVTNWDLAYGVEQLVALTGLKYGGPNNSTTAGDAFGGISFQVWDPQPITAGAQLAVDTSGRVDLGKVAGTAQTARDLGAQLDAAISTRAAASTALSTATWTGTRATALDNLDAAVSSRLATSGYTAPDNTRPTNFNALAITAGGAVTAGTVGDKTGYALTAAYDPAKTAASSVDYTSARAAKLDNLDAAISTRSTYGGGDTAGTTTLLARLTAGRATALDNLDAAISTRLAAASYTAPDNAGVAAIRFKTDNLPPDPADASDIAAAFGTVNSNVIAVGSAVAVVQAKTDQLSFSVAGRADVNVLNVKGIAVNGSGTAIDPWGP